MGGTLGRLADKGNHFMHTKGHYVIAGVFGYILLRWQYNKRIVAPREKETERKQKEKEARAAAAKIAAAAEAEAKAAEEKAHAEVDDAHELASEDDHAAPAPAAASHAKPSGAHHSGDDEVLAKHDADLVAKLGATKHAAPAPAAAAPVPASPAKPSGGPASPAKPSGGHDHKKDKAEPAQEAKHEPATIAAKPAAGKAAAHH